MERPHFSVQPDWPVVDDEIHSVLAECWRDGSWGRYEGPHQDRLRQLLAEMHGVEHVLLCCSGTIAVELALRGLQLGAGDEVALAGYDFSGNFRAIEAVSARPVLVDLAPASWCLDVEQLPAAASPQLRAVIVSHLHGTHGDMVQLREFAERNSLAVIEDACQCPGAIVQGRVAGSWGDVGVLSFGGSKLLTAGRGGAVLTSRPEIAQRIKVFSERGNQAFPLSELQAAVLPPQISKLPARNAHRRQSVDRLIAGLQGIPGWRPVRCERPGDWPSYYKLAFLHDAEVDGRSRAQLIAALQSAGVPADEGFRGFARRSANRCRQVGTLERSRRAAEGAVLLHHPVLLEPFATIDQLAQVIRAVK